MEVIAANADLGFHRSCCGPAPKTKIRRHKCDVTPYSRPCQQCTLCLGYEDTEQNDVEFLGKGDSLREFDDLTNLVFSTTSESTETHTTQSACHSNPSPTTFHVSMVDSMVATPPCLFDNMSSTQEILQNTVEHELKLSSFSTIDTQQQKQPHYDNFAADPTQRANGSPMACDTSPTSTTVELEKPKKLEDFKVQDLKNECKKRQLPVSGAKPQLLERLRPYEESILLTANGFPHNARDRKTSNEEACSYEPISQSHEIMSSYPKQMSTSHSIPQQTLPNASGNILQFNSSQQLVQLVDSTGIIVGVATVQTPPACCCSAPTQSVEMPMNCSSSNERLLPSVTIRQPTVTFPLSLQSNSPQPTFSFAQHGSGGQFTLAPQENTQSMENQEARQMESRPVMKSHTNHAIERRTSICCQQPPKPLNANLAVRPRPRCFSGPVQKSKISFKHCSIASTPVVPLAQTSPAVGDQPGPSPNLPPPSSSSVNGAQAANYPVKSNLPCEAEDATSIVLSAQTFSIHEDMLRLQQKKIEELQAELTKSQLQLRQQQQAILNAKKAQVKLESGIVDPVQAAFLNKLDIKNLNKYHIQLFLQHKLQLQKLQVQVQEFKTLQSAESRLQEELHIEQAVQDIVRLIKQDSRTALLIVQLLRRYQIERNCSTNSTTNATPTTSTEQGESRAQETVSVVNTEVNGQKSASCQNAEPQNQCAGEQAQNCTSNCMCTKTARHIPEQNGHDQITTDNGEIETIQTKDNTDGGNCKKSSKGAPKKRNGIKSIWSRMNSLKALNHKETSQSKCAGTDNTKTNSGSQGSSTVDMEEIFRTVLEDASKALNESDNSYASQTTANASVERETEAAQIQAVYTTTDKMGSPVQEIHNGGTLGEVVTSCPIQPQYLDFNASVQTYVEDSSYAFHSQVTVDAAAKTDSAYEIRDANVVYVSHNPISDNSVEAQPLPPPTSQVSDPYDNKDFDELMDVLQRNEEESVMYCSSSMNGLSNYEENGNEQWIEGDYSNSSPNQNHISSDGYGSVYCGMNDVSGTMSQQMQWGGELETSVGQSAVLLGDHGLFGMPIDIGSSGAFDEPIYMQQGVSISDDYSS
ncbi:hypothetical protein QR680_001665 [Steinernema hermaphroditum]|uniref:SAP domain-containing protein n=1 Tax=Steinernema hermaphroditum TaxID=289476 RepID=A0AA39GZA2_9BILA|nr:hypothetical protein QR680_001665 [Steinernema hermaphroditum]